MKVGPELLQQSWGQIARLQRLLDRALVHLWLLCGQPVVVAFVLEDLCDVRERMLQNLDAVVEDEVCDLAPVDRRQRRRVLRLL